MIDSYITETHLTIFEFLWCRNYAVCIRLSDLNVFTSEMRFICLTSMICWCIAQNILWWVLCYNILLNKSINYRKIKLFVALFLSKITWITNCELYTCRCKLTMGDRFGKSEYILFYTHVNSYICIFPRIQNGIFKPLYEYGTL